MKKKKIHTIFYKYLCHTNHSENFYYLSFSTINKYRVTDIQLKRSLKEDILFDMTNFFFQTITFFVNSLIIHTVV